MGVIVGRYPSAATQRTTEWYIELRVRSLKDKEKKPIAYKIQE